MFDKNMSNEERQEILAQTMATPEGRIALSQAMVEPIRRSLEYQGCGRKTLLVDVLPQGALPRYERDPEVVATVLARRGAVPDSIIEGEEVLVPTFEIAVNPQVRLAEIKARRFYVVDRAQIKAKEAIQKIEDQNIFNALSAAVDNRAEKIVTNIGSLSPASINTAFKFVEQHDLVASKIICHPNQYASIRMFGKDFFDEATTREILTSGLFGHMWTADIHVSSQVPVDSVIITASPDTVGAMPIRQDITVLPADDPKNLRLGWVIYEEIGVVIMNSYAVSRIDVSSGT